MTPTTKTLLKWLTFGVGLPFAVFIILGLIIVATHKDTPEQMQIKRDKYIEDSTRRVSRGRQ